MKSFGQEGHGSGETQADSAQYVSRQASEAPSDASVENAQGDAMSNDTKHDVSDEGFLRSEQVRTVDDGNVVTCGWPQPPCTSRDGEPEDHEFDDDALSLSSHRAVSGNAPFHSASLSLRGSAGAGEHVRRSVRHTQQHQLSLDAMLQQPLKFNSKVRTGHTSRICLSGRERTCISLLH
jgi:hypothetical protein